MGLVSSPTQIVALRQDKAENIALSERKSTVNVASC